MVITDDWMMLITVYIMKSQTNGKYDYGAFLASKPSAQEVTDFITYINYLPNPNPQDIQTRIAACQQVKNRSERVQRGRYSYDSQFLMYERLVWDYQHEVLGKTYECFKKAVDLGIEAMEVIPGDDGVVMGARTEILLRYPEQKGFDAGFRNIEKADLIKKKRLQGPYFSQERIFYEFRWHDIKEAQIYAPKGSQKYFFCRLYLDKSKEAYEYFQKEWKMQPKVEIGWHYYNALQIFKPQVAESFMKELQDYLHTSDIGGYSALAVLELRKYSYSSDIYSWLSDPKEPSQEDALRSLKHSDMCIAHIKELNQDTPYYYRTQMFSLHTKGWVYAHLMPKTKQNYCEALTNYKEALSYFINTNNFEKQLQYAHKNYITISKEVIKLITVPNDLNFQNSFKTEPCAEKIFKELLTMLETKETVFPYIKQLRTMFKLGTLMKEIKNVKNKVFQQKQVDLVEKVVTDVKASEKPQQVENQLMSLIWSNKKEGDELEQILNDPELNAYYEGFTRTFSDTYIASVSVTQDFFQLEIKKAIPIKVITFLTSMIPLIGDQVTTVIGGVLEYADQENTKARASHIAKLAPSTNRLNAIAQTLVIHIIKEQTNQIKTLEKTMLQKGKKNTPFLQNLLKKIKEYQVKVKKEIFNATELFDSCEMEMGNHHASLLINNVVASGALQEMKKPTPKMKIEAMMNYMLTHKQSFQINFEEEEVEKEYKLQPEGIDLSIPKQTVKKQIQATDQGPRNENGDNQKFMGCCGTKKIDCLIYCASEIIYDNLFLNHPHLLIAAYKAIGIDQTLQLCKGMTPEAAKPLIQKNDPDFLLETLLSLHRSQI